MAVISFPLEVRELPRDARDRQVRSEEELGQFGGGDGILMGDHLHNGFICGVADAGNHG